MSEDEIRAALDAAKLRALSMLEQWASKDTGRYWSCKMLTSDGKQWGCLLCRDAFAFDKQILMGSTQHDAMAKACEAIRGEL